MWGEIALTVQDPGKPYSAKEKGKSVTRYKYPLLEKLSSKLCTSIERQFPDSPLTKNQTRLKKALVFHITSSRKHVDAVEQDPFYLPFSKDGKVFLITNNPTTSGLNIAINRFQDACLATQQQKNSARTFNDGIRLACILLDPSHRATVAGIMTKKRDRKKSDQNGDTTFHFLRCYFPTIF